MIVRLAKNSFKLINGKPTLNSMAQTNNTATTLTVWSVIASLIKKDPVDQAFVGLPYFHLIVFRQMIKINAILKCFEGLKLLKQQQLVLLLHIPVVVVDV